MSFPALALIVAGCLSPQEAELPRADVILDRLDALLGERVARAALPHVVLRGTVSVAGMDQTGRFEELHSGSPAPAGADGSLGSERVLIRQEFPGSPETTQGTDGIASWTSDPGLGVAVIEGDAQGAARRLWAIGRSASWRDLYAQAETKSLVEREGRPVYEIELTPRAGAADVWYVDRERDELVAIALAMPNPTGGTLPMEYVFSDWKTVGGVRYAGRRVQKVMGMEIVYVVDAVEQPASVEAGRLAPPPDVAAALADKSQRAPAPPEGNPEECAVETLKARAVASIRVVIPADQVSARLAELLPEVVRALGEQGAEAAGPPFSRYHRIDAAKNEIDIEAGIPVRKPVTANGRVAPAELPGGKLARTWHIGAYHDLPRSYARLEKWIQAQGLATRGPFFEIYWTDPGLEPDPKNWRTQILWPVE